MERKYESGNFIYLLRTEKGYTQEQVAKMLGVTNKAVSKWETGAAVPRMDHLVRLAEILGCTQEELYLGRRKTDASQNDASDGPDVTDDYLAIVRRCDCCKHEVTSISALLGLRPVNYIVWAITGLFAFLFSTLIPERKKQKKTAVCTRCGASISLTEKSEAILILILFVLFLLVSYAAAYCVTWLDTYEINSVHYFASAEDAKEYGKILDTVEKYLGRNGLYVITFEAICASTVIYEVAIGIYLLLRLFVKRKILKYLSYRIIRYPHAEDGKIVF